MIAAQPAQGEPRHPEVAVELSQNTDGNAMVIIGKVSGALRAAGHGPEVAEFINQAMDGDYDHVLQTCMAWVTVT